MSNHSAFRAIALVLLIGLSRQGPAEENYAALKSYVQSEDRVCIRRDELATYLVEKSDLLKKGRTQSCGAQEMQCLAERWADAIIAMASLPLPDGSPNASVAAAPVAFTGCAISLDDASLLLGKLAKTGITAHGCKVGTPAPSEDTVWSKVTIKRDFTDSFDPRQAKLTLPAVLSYLYDAEAASHPYQTTLIGALTYPLIQRGVIVSLGVDADVEPTKLSSADVVDAGLGLSYRWMSKLPEKTFFESVLFSATPKFTTDSSFKSKVYQLGLSVLPTSKQFLQMGFEIPLRPLGLVAVWQPTGGLEFGRVADPGDNQKLAAIQTMGAYTRVLAQLGIQVWPTQWDPLLTLAGTYTLRYDTSQQWWRYFCEVLLEQDLDDKNTFSVTLAYRRGRKPPDFVETRQLLFGIGVKK